jgi:hypothetical protein
MRRELIVKCLVGDIPTKVYAVTGKETQGSFVTTGEKQGYIGIIEIGIDGNWTDVLVTVFHETTEMTLSMMMLAYHPVAAFQSNPSGRVFIITHEQFSEAIARAGCAMSRILPGLEKAWKRRQKQQGK